MYWAKKILEWTKSPKIALRTGLYFNDRFALDGNDPNGFTGVGWSVMGIHDMGWKERPIFGKIRFMNYAGCKRKFKVDMFVAKYNNIATKVKTGNVEVKKGKVASKSATSRKAPASPAKPKRKAPTTATATAASKKRKAPASPAKPKRRVPAQKSVFDRLQKKMK